MNFDGKSRMFNRDVYDLKRLGASNHLNSNIAFQMQGMDSNTNRVYIQDLQPGPVNKKVYGLVIAKYEARSFPDKKNYNQMRHSCCFVLRDSPHDFINVTCWGQEAFIRNITQSFKVGDAIELDNCMVQTKQNNEYEEKYRPKTPSPFQITVNETHSKVSQFSGNDLTEFDRIAHLPVKDSDDYYTLDDIITNSHNLNDQCINVLAVVKDPGVTKDITTKTGRSMKRREVKLFDDTCLAFPLIIWDAEVAELANSWTSNESVLFLFDVKVTFEMFRQKMVATCTSKTIIVINPDIPEAYHLFNYAQSVPSFNEDLSNDINDIDISAIRDVFTLRELQEKIETPSILPLQNVPFFGITYACISYFDIDGGQNSIVTRCSSCRRRVNQVEMECAYPSCVGDHTTTRSFEIRLSLSDHTASINGFLLASPLAEQVLGCDLQSFTHLDDQDKTDLKWNFLFERFKIYFKASPSGQDRHQFSYNIIALEPINMREMLQNEL